jgi:hypothetical protein
VLLRSNITEMEEVKPIDVSGNANQAAGDRLYSVRRVLAGFAVAALMACKLIVARAMTSARAVCREQRVGAGCAGTQHSADTDLLCSLFGAEGGQTEEAVDDAIFLLL